MSLLSRAVGGSHRKRVSTLHGCTPLTVDHLIEWYLSSHGYIHGRILKKDEIWWPYQGNTSHDVRNQFEESYQSTSAQINPHSHVNWRSCKSGRYVAGRVAGPALELSVRAAGQVAGRPLELSH